MARDETQLLEMGARIAELRKASGLKQQAIADYCGVELRTYQFWQQGKHPPSGEPLEKLADLFKVTPRYILRGGTGDTPDPLTGHGSQLDRIERLLDELNRRLADLEERVADGAMTTAIQEAFEDYANRLGREIGKHPVRSRRTADRPREVPPVVA